MFVQNETTSLESKRLVIRVLQTAESGLSRDPYARVKELNYEIAEKIANLQAVTEYIGMLCQRLHSIYLEYGADTAEMEPETSKHGTGHVQASNIEEVIRSGNLRERMTLLINIAQGKKRYLWRAITEWDLKNKRNKLLNHSVLLTRIHRMYPMTGLHDVHAIAQSFPEVLDTPRDGAVLLSRLGVWQDQLRTQRPTADQAMHRIPIRRIYPQLSSFEIGFLKKHNPEWNEIHCEYAPWQTGLMYWIINPNHPYTKLASKHNQEVISGPSRTTDAVLALAELFNEFNLELTVLACAAFLCGAQHHSAWEVLLAAIPFGLPYDSKVDAYEYIHDQLVKYTIYKGNPPSLIY